MSELMRSDRAEVVVTGVGAVSPFGTGTGALIDGLAAGRSAIRVCEELAAVRGLRCCLAGLAGEMRCEWLDRRFRRTMSRMSLMAAEAAREAIHHAGLSPQHLRSPRSGVCAGSTVGSTIANEAFFRQYLQSQSIENIRSTAFFMLMSHTVSANLAQAFGVGGRTICPTAACATSAMAIGLAYEAIARHQADVMICGGTDEHHPLTTAVFDLLDAASTQSPACPDGAPRPFDANRDGVVCSEGAGILILESAAHARRRNAPVLAEVVGFATNNACGSLSHSDSRATADCIRAALDVAGLAPGDIAYINAHATGTLQGDAQEGQGIFAVFADRTPVSSLKGHLGHTLAASAALESIASIEMMRRGVIWPTRNLETLDPGCGRCDYVRRERHAEIQFVLKNSSALGGTNAVLVLGRPRNG